MRIFLIVTFMMVLPLAAFLGFFPGLIRTFKQKDAVTNGAEMQNPVLHFLWNWLVLTAWCVIPAILLTLIFVAMAL